MRFTHRFPLLTTLLALLLTACVQPISKEVRNQVDPKTTLAMLNEKPVAFLDQQLIIGGVLISLETTEGGSLLELMEWRLNSWGEPSYLDDAGQRFLVKTSEILDQTIYEPGVLITLAGVYTGQEPRLLGEHDYNYPVFDLTEIHLWESPFRYGLHNNPDPAYPVYVDQDDDSRSNPYDPGYKPYPYTQYWYRNLVH